MKTDINIKINLTVEEFEKILKRIGWFEIYDGIAKNLGRHIQDDEYARKYTMAQFLPMVNELLNKKKED